MSTTTVAGPERASFLSWLMYGSSSGWPCGAPCHEGGHEVMQAELVNLKVLRKLGTGGVSGLVNAAPLGPTPDWYNLPVSPAQQARVRPARGIPFFRGLTICALSSRSIHATLWTSVTRSRWAKERRRASR